MKNVAEFNTVGDIEEYIVALKEYAALVSRMKKAKEAVAN